MTFDADNRDVVAAYRASAETFLVIELADASLRYDQQSKIPVYAVARINEVWIVDLIRNPHLHLSRRANGS
jgi:Uma2 family endonuclease